MLSLNILFPWTKSKLPSFFLPFGGNIQWEVRMVNNKSLRLLDQVRNAIRVNHYSRKYPNAGSGWAWQYVFPVAKRLIDPRFGVGRRHHLDEKVLQRAVKQALRSAGIPKNGSCHTMLKFDI